MSNLVVPKSTIKDQLLALTMLHKFRNTAVLLKRLVKCTVEKS